MRILYCWEVGRVRNGGSPAMLETDFISQIGDVAELRLYSRTTVTDVACYVSICGIP